MARKCVLIAPGRRLQRWTLRRHRRPRRRRPRVTQETGSPSPCSILSLRTRGPSRSAVEHRLSMRRRTCRRQGA
eukprot:7696153-Heterocapsa_arctica.AAC.1